MPVTITVTSDLPTSADRVWTTLLSPATTVHLCRGLIGFPALVGRAAPMQAGERGRGWVLLFHVVPLHRHAIEVLAVDPATRTISTHEHGGPIRAWNHVLHAEPTGEWSCRYSDTVEIDAGPLTPVVAAGARVLYRYRHRRWRRLVARHLLPAGPQYAR